MNLPARKRKKINTLAIAFLLPFAGMLIVMAARQFIPFGPYNMLYSDMYYQYYPFFVAFRQALREGRGLIYTWSVGMGLDYLGLIAYYMASPLNLLSVLVPERLLLAYYTLIMPVKLGLASLFFAVFLKKHFRRDDLSVALFGGLYALCAWALGYHWNVMWLDTFALLPLVALGTVALVRDKKFVLYTVTLFLSVFLNYYVGLFTCVFVFLLFFCQEICRWRGFRRFLADFIRIGFFSVLAIGMTALLELPALAALQNTQSSVNNFPHGFQLNIADENTWRGLLDAMRQVAGNLGGGLEPTFREGLPNLYCGVGTVFLACLFLTSREVRLRDKLCCLALLLFFTVSFIIRQLDYIWHGFHFTNMLPYRFSFLFSFVLLYMAYTAFLQRSRFRLWQLLLSGALAVLLFACSDHRGEAVYLSYNLAFFLLYFVTLLLGTVRRRPPLETPEEAGDEYPETVGADSEIFENIPEPENGAEIVDNSPEIVENLPEIFENTAETAENGSEIPETDTDIPEPPALPPEPFLGERAVSILLSVIMGLELVAQLVCFGCWFPGNGVTDFPKGGQDTARVVAQMKAREQDTLFYRADVTHSQTHNDSALNGFDGVSVYSSSANLRVTEYMRAMGFVARNTYNRFCYEETSPTANLFLNLKYLLERDGREPTGGYFTPVAQQGKAMLWENNYYLPLGFLAESALGELEFSGDGDPFTFQNKLMAAASGVEGTYLSAVPTANLAITASEGVELSPQVGGRYASYTGGAKSGTVSFSYTAHKEGLACVHVFLSGRYNFRVYINGVEQYAAYYYLPQILAVGQVEPGDVIEVRQNVSANLKGSMTIRAAVLDRALFDKAYAVLSASTLELTDFSSTLVEGTIDCDRDGLLYTSVPWDGNWQTFVDGEAVESVLVGDCMIALPLTKGPHTVTLRYHSAAFSFGWKVSLVCAIVFLAAVLLRRRPRLVSLRGRHTKKH